MIRTLALRTIPVSDCRPIKRSIAIWELYDNLTAWRWRHRLLLHDNIEKMLPRWFTGARYFELHLYHNWPQYNLKDVSHILRAIFKICFLKFKLCDFFFDCQCDSIESDFCYKNCVSLFNSEQIEKSLIKTEPKLRTRYRFKKKKNSTYGAITKIKFLAQNWKSKKKIRNKLSSDEQTMIIIIYLNIIWQIK